ncbi:MAG: TetR/AcrR family transcriptional regulator [Rhodobacterales bacterium]
MSENKPFKNSSEPAADPRRKAILKAAFEAFSTYGYRRTSMEDIARASGMSRAALYLHYRNKEDIFRSLAQFYYDDAVAQVRAVLARDLPLQEALSQAFEAQTGQIFEALLSSPHGDELLDTKYASSADIAQAGAARLVAVYAGWLDQQASTGRATLAVAGGDATALAATMMAALHGLKTPMPAPAAYRAAAALLAAVFARALTPA